MLPSHSFSSKALHPKREELYISVATLLQAKPPFVCLFWIHVNTNGKNMFSNAIFPKDTYIYILPLAEREFGDCEI